jgi:hypothetical protein
METPNRCYIFRVSCFSFGKQRSSVRIKDVCTPLPEGKHMGLSYPSDNWVLGVLKSVCVILIVMNESVERENCYLRWSIMT